MTASPSCFCGGTGESESLILVSNTHYILDTDVKKQIEGVSRGRWWRRERTGQNLRERELNEPEPRAEIIGLV